MYIVNQLVGLKMITIFIRSEVCIKERGGFQVSKWSNTNFNSICQGTLWICKNVSLKIILKTKPTPSRY
jgi:hypothetical protein